MNDTEDDDVADICPCSESEAAAALSLIVARVMASNVDPTDIVIVRRDLFNQTEWQVEHRPRKEGGN
jgi:hypothetical protein